tara:strand:+ start:801 stop:1013 length:213 start_codon:yes stop_codon:yes gene_type:complete
MNPLLAEASDIFEKKVLSVKDYKRFREIGRQISDKDRLLFASFNEGMFQRLTEIASKVGHYDWLEPEDED